MEIAAESRRLLAEAGLSFNPFADGVDDRARWRFDPAPVVLAGGEWLMLAAGAVQRARLIDAVLGDLYGAQTLIRDGRLPPSTLASPRFIRAAARWGATPLGRLTLYAVDVARRPDGVWVVLDDHVDMPEGLGWAVANRVALSQAASELFVDVSPRRLGGFMSALSGALAGLSHGDGRRALLTGGAADPAYFSHAYIARYLDLTLVEPADLTARDGAVHVKTLEGLRQVDVALRMAPSVGIDPVSAPGPSALAPPGVLHAARMGKVAFANMIGAGVLDGRILAPRSADLIGRMLGEEQILFEADHLDLTDPNAREAYLDEPDRWRVSLAGSASRPGAPDPVDPLAELDRDGRARALRRDGWRFSARARTPLSTAPAFADGDGRGGLV
ncbi:MAG: circularly permuted type 2 ATP-grasp protein, partial [Pseudomonadota bacterium]